MVIDRVKVISDLSQLTVSGNSDGLIPSYGVLLQQLPASFWNTFSERMLQAATGDLRQAAEVLLENAAAECGYHTGHGIVNSKEFEAVVAPMIDSHPEDMLHGLYCVFSSWGWADASIVDLDPGHRMVVHARDYYEADILSASAPCAFMIRGVSRAFMDLAYGAPYPDGLGRYKCTQTMGIEVGDPHGEFVVTPL
ncbi:hypothetical protein GF420_15515 [candidate division GN15 bacterium]|nr:hypothetical protein [candidate division GN15 bacterium]